MAWPRGAAVAEVGWSPLERRDFHDFLLRLIPQFRRYRARGVQNADLLFRVKIAGTLDRAKQRASVTLSNESGLGEIRYTIDGTDPTNTSPRYTSPLDLPLSTRNRGGDVQRWAAAHVAQRRTLDASFFQRRNSHQLKLCSEAIALSIEDDGPVDRDDRAVFLTDIMNPCWIDPAVDLTNGATLVAAVGQLPFNFQIGDDVKKIELRPPATPEGELEVFAGGCSGPRIASLPLAPAAAEQGVTVLPTVRLEPRSGGPQDLCFRFTQRTVEPMWAVQWIEIRPMILAAPMDGWASALDEVPDPVFSRKVMGDGLAIDPTSGRLCAPCDGEVIALHAAKHAVTLRATNGAEILLHIGCDTVALGGEGFDTHVTQGRSVRAGDPLVSFDLDGVASRVPSLVTPVIIIDGGGFAVVRREQPRAVRTGDFLMELGPLSSSTAVLRVPFEHGIHARACSTPRGRAARIFRRRVRGRARPRANARSAVAWMELGAQRDDEITLIAAGPDAAAALAALEAAFAAPHVPRATPAQSRAVTLSPHSENGALRGIVASRGIAIGPAALIAGSTPLPSEAGAGIARETADLEHARALVRAQLERVHATASGVAREVLEAHLSFIDDPELLQKTEASIARGKSAGFAWREAVEESANALRAVGDPRVAERADDLRDLAGQLMRALAGEAPVLDPPAGSILIGEELLPSQLVSLPPGRIAGFCIAAGGPTSHVALLAASMNMPALVAAGPRVLHIDEGTPLVLDAEQGLLRIAPDAAELQAAEETLSRLRSQRERRRRPRTTSAGSPAASASSLGKRGSAVRCPRGARARRRGMRSAAHRVPLPRPRHGAGSRGADQRLPEHRHRVRGRAGRDPDARRGKR
jgi:phosphotransferase system HPr (HPr) family protein